MTQYPSEKPSPTTQTHHSPTPQSTMQDPPPGPGHLHLKYAIPLLIVLALLIAVAIYFATYSVVALGIEGLIVTVLAVLVSLRQFRELAEAALDHMIGFTNRLLVIRPTKLWVPWLITAFSLLLTLIVILVTILPSLFVQKAPCSTLPCYVYLGDQYIGISDGSDGFSHWQDGSRNGDRITLTNTENLIKTENSNISSYTSTTLTLIVMTTLSSGSDQGYGIDDLQGIYALQHEVNKSCVKTCLKIRLLIANAGTDMQYADTVVDQIESLPATEHILGVVGLPVSTSYARDAIQQLSKAQILMLSATESSDILTGISRYYFRIAPPDSEQGAIDADKAERDSPSAQYAVVFYADDPVHPYGRTLASAFIERFTQVSAHHVITETYDASKSNSVQNIAVEADLNNMVGQIPPGASYIIYFAGYANTLSFLLNNLPQTSRSRLREVISGNAAYDLRDYVAPTYEDINFTAFASPDEWGSVPAGDSTPCDFPPLDGDQYGKNFCAEYSGAFGFLSKSIGTPYGSTRADSTVILAYDSASVLVHACVEAREVNNVNYPSADAIRTILLKHAFEGVSGQIVFGSDGNPLNKPIVWLRVGTNGKTVFEGFVQGQPQAPRTTSSTYDWKL